MGESGAVNAVMEENPGTSVLTWNRKVRHMEEIEKIGEKLGPKMAGIKEKKEAFLTIEFQRLELPSQKPANE